MKRASQPVLASNSADIQQLWMPVISYDGSSTAILAGRLTPIPGIAIRICR